MSEGVYQHVGMDLSSDSDLVMDMGERSIGELMAVAHVSLSAVAMNDGEEKAGALHDMGVSVSEALFNDICGLANDNDLDDIDLAYLTCVVAANVAISALNHVDRLKFSLELEEM